MSKCWGWLAERQVPTSMRPTVYGLYSSTFGVNLQEAAIEDLKYVQQRVSLNNLTFLLLYYKFILLQRNGFVK